jgi:hypothetical protein
MKTLFETLSSTVLLNYAPNTHPSPLQVGDSGVLQIVVNNPGDTTILLRQIVISMLADDPTQQPPYSEAVDLLANTAPNGVASIVSSDGASWLVGQAGNTFTFTPQGSTPVQMQGQALTLTLQGLPISTVVGTAQVTVKEWGSASATPPDPKRQPCSGEVVIDIPKFPDGFAVTSFTAQPLSVDQGGNTTLSWVASEGTQTITYGNGNGNVTVPGPNDPPLPESGSYVARNLQVNPTVFTLTSTDPQSGLSIQNQIVVGVNPAKPQVTSFSATAQYVDQGVTITFEWTTQGAQSCTLSCTAEELEPNSPVGGYPLELQPSQVRPSYQLTASNGALSAVSTIQASSWSQVQSLALQEIVTGVAVSADGSRVYLTSMGTNAVTIYAWDGSGSLGSPVRLSIALQYGIPTAVAPSADGQRLYVGSIGLAADVGFFQVFDTGGAALGERQNIPGNSMGVVVSPDGTRVYVLATNSLAQFDGSGDFPISLLAFSTSADAANPVQLLGQAVAVPGSVGASPGLAISADGTQLWVGLMGSIAVFETSTNLNQPLTFQQAVPVGSNLEGVGGLSLVPGHSYLAAVQGNAVSLLDSSTLAVALPAISVGSHPAGVAMRGSMMMCVTYRSGVGVYSATEYSMGEGSQVG